MIDDWYTTTVSPNIDTDPAIGILETHALNQRQTLNNALVK